MGLFSFLKKSGDDVFSEEDNAADTAAANAAKANSLKNIVADYGIEVDGLSVDVDGDKATVSGKVDSQADKEKVVLILGNVEGIATVDDHLTVEHPAPEAKFHEVKKGDSLSKIAKEYYGDPMKYPVIFEANKPMLKDPNLIYPGQVLRIPPQNAA